MKKRLFENLFFVMVMAVLCMTVAVTASAATKHTEGYYTYEIQNGEAVITDVDTTINGEVVIPDTLGGYPVTVIDDYAFYYCKNIISITIPNQVKDIGETVFAECSSLKTIIIPEGITSIGKNAFWRCVSLNEILIPNSVTSIGVDAFEQCSSLSSITIPDNVKSIGNGAFSYCTNLEKINVDDENIYFSDVNDVLFNKDLTELIRYPSKKSDKEYNIPAGTNKISAKAFESCDNLVNITIPVGVSEIAQGTFYHCSNLTHVTIPEGISSIGPSAFYECRKLASINIPESVKNIGESAFTWCSKIKSIIIPEGVTHINAYTFYYCTSLENVVLPNSITTIGSMAFENCYNIENIIIPNNVTDIKSSAFMRCEKLKTITLGNSLSKIGTNAFSQCDELKHVGYTGTESQWSLISISNDNKSLINAPYLHYSFNPETDITENITASTCQTQGTKETVCSCGYSYGTETLPLAECSFTAYAADNNADCLNDGTKTAYCDYGCKNKNTVTDEGSALGHDMGEFVTVLEGNCTINGLEKAECSRCDYSETIEIIATNHKDENLDGTCDYCNEYIADTDCLCVCHAKTIGAFIYKLFKAIDKIFKTNLVEKIFGITDICACGIKH